MNNYCKVSSIVTVTGRVVGLFVCKMKTHSCATKMLFVLEMPLPKNIMTIIIDLPM